MTFGTVKAFLMFSLGSMTLALVTGIFRLSTISARGGGALSELYGLHSIIMVFGFLEVMIMTERVVALDAISGANNFRLHTVMVPLIILGVTLEILGYIEGLILLRSLGALALVGGSVAFLQTLQFLRKMTESKLPFDYMMLSVVSLILAAVISAFTLPVHSIGFVMLLIAFPLLFILGERVELTRLTATGLSTIKFRIAFVASSGSVLSFAVGTIRAWSQFSNQAFTLGSCLLLAVFFVMLVEENRNMSRLLKTGQRLQRYTALHVKLAYLWAVVGMILAVSFGLTKMTVNLYDAFIHVLTVGFIGTMILAHGPVILPGLLRRRFVKEKLSLLPLGALTVAVSLRVFSALAQITVHWSLVKLAVEISGWLVFAAVLLFLGSILSGIKKPIS